MTKKVIKDPQGDDEEKPNCLTYNEAEWVKGEDKVLCSTLFLEGYWMQHEPHDACWCDPDTVDVVNRDGELVGYVVRHRDRQ